MTVKNNHANYYNTDNNTERIHGRRLQFTEPIAGRVAYTYTRTRVTFTISLKILRWILF